MAKIKKIQKIQNKLKEAEEENTLLLEQLFQVQVSLEEQYIKNNKNSSTWLKEQNEIKHKILEDKRNYEISLQEKNQKVDDLIEELSKERKKDRKNEEIEKYKKEIEIMRNSLNVVKKAYHVSLLDIENKFKTLTRG